MEQTSCETTVTQADLERTVDLLERTGAMAKVGGWELDLATAEVTFSREAARIHEVDFPYVPPKLSQGEEFYPPDAWPTIQAAVQAAIEHGTAYDLESPFITAKGRRIWVRVQGFAVVEKGKTAKLRGTIQDITDRKTVEEALKVALEVQKTLLHEVHHRVKNNLQIISSLLRMETARCQQSDAKHALLDMQGRVLSMAVLHELLYREGTLASADISVYLRSLAIQLFRTLLDGHDGVRLQLELAPVQIGMDQAVSCGLLVNELISNCMKHGFADGRSGEVRIVLHPMQDLEQGKLFVRLCVSDTGVGLASDYAVKQNSSLGLKLAGDLSRQLGGVLEIGPTGGPGSEFTLTFEVDQSKLPA